LHVLRRVLFKNLLNERLSEIEPVVFVGGRQQITFYALEVEPDIRACLPNVEGVRAHLCPPDDLLFVRQVTNGGQRQPAKSDFNSAVIKT
jgi:hypothetical protein